jgi:hypothetical protein
MMTMNIRRLYKGITVFGVLCAAFANTHCASEPAIKCAITSGAGGAARYKMTAVAKMGACGFDFPFAVGGVDVGEKLAIENYPPVNTDPNRDQEVATIAVRSVYVGNRLSLAGTIDDNLPSIAQGKFTAVYPDGNDLCHVDTFGLATADLPQESMDSDGNAITPPLPATHIEYQWSNWRTIVKPSSIGGQSFAHLKYTQDGCTAEYDVAILTPEVDCSSNDDCQAGNDPYNVKSHIAPEANASCNTDVGLCLSSKDAP